MTVELIVRGSLIEIEVADRTQAVQRVMEIVEDNDKLDDGSIVFTLDGEAMTLEWVNG